MKKRISREVLLLQAIYDKCKSSVDITDSIHCTVEGTHFFFSQSLLTYSNEIKEILNSLDWKKNSIQVRFMNRTHGELWTDSYAAINLLIAMGISLNLICFRNDQIKVGRRALIKKNYN